MQRPHRENQKGPSIDGPFLCLCVIIEQLRALTGRSSLYDKARTIPRLDIIHGGFRDALEMVLYLLVYEHLESAGFNDGIRGLFQLIQSQSQTGPSSTKSCKRNPEGREFQV